MRHAEVFLQSELRKLESYLDQKKPRNIDEVRNLVMRSPYIDTAKSRYYGTDHFREYQKRFSKRK